MMRKKLISAAVALLIVSGCAQQQQVSENSTATGDSASPSDEKFSTPFSAIARKFSKKRNHETQNKTSPKKSDDVWSVIENELAFANDVPDRKIAPQLDWLNGNQKYFDNTLARANIYLPYVLDRVMDAGLPAEVALLPFIESAYNPFAYSRSGAAGLWQFIPSTGNTFGLEQNRWFEGRRDIVESTDAAIRYIQILNDQFDGDWLLTFAAYNGGPGTVQRAIEANQRRGLDTDFWSLELSDETRRYVPRLVALSKVITQPDKYDIDRMSIPAKPTFEVVELEKPIDLAQAARIAGIETEAIYHLNPGYTRWVTPPVGPHRLVLPTGKADDFLDQLANLPTSKWQPRREYIVRKGDTLGRIAKAHGSSAQELAAVNNLSTNAVIRIGQVLHLPSTAAEIDTFGTPAMATASPGTPSLNTYRVKPGDSLWSIARAHDVKATDLLAWNKLNARAVIKPGQVLKLHQQVESGPENASNYQVKSGDSLYNIARRFQVQVQDLVVWNDLGSTALIKPGQHLKIYQGN